MPAFLRRNPVIAYGLSLADYHQFALRFRLIPLLDRKVLLANFTANRVAVEQVGRPDALFFRQAAWRAAILVEAEIAVGVAAAVQRGGLERGSEAAGQGADEDDRESSHGAFSLAGGIRDYRLIPSACACPTRGCRRRSRVKAISALRCKRLFFP
ncbi:hypothetical protein D3C80_1422450 [compost metagenome]